MTINRKQLGDLKLTDKQEDLLMAFLKTLTDGYLSSANYPIAAVSSGNVSKQDCHEGQRMCLRTTPYLAGSGSAPCGRVTLPR